MKIADGFELRKIAGENIVVCTRTDINFTETITINDSGEFIWERLKEGRSRAEIIETMCKEFDASEDIIKEDTNAFLDKAVSLNIVIDD